MKEIIAKKLTDEFQPDYLEVIDESHKHAGHLAGGAINTHFLVKIKAKLLEDKTLLATHKMIFSCLKEEMRNKIHALSIKIQK